MKQSYLAGVAAASVLALGVYASAQTQAPQAPAGAPAAQGAPQGAPPAGAPPAGAPGQGPGRMGGAGRGPGGATTAFPSNRPLHITGENPGLALRLVANGPIVSEVNYWRVAWSPVGTGSVCYLMTGDGKGKDDLRLVLTDNEKLANFVTYDTMSKLVPGFGEPPYKVVKATFKFTGDSINERSEYCTSDKYKVVATWRKMNPGTWGSMSPNNGFFMMFNIQMAPEGDITLNGKKLPGTVLPGPGRPPSYLAFAETWLKTN